MTDWTDEEVIEFAGVMRVNQTVGIIISGFSVCMLAMLLCFLVSQRRY